MQYFDKKGKKPLGSRIEDELMKYILHEPIEPGHKIPNEFELAEKFGVGRSTIREAVKGLASRGILQVRRGSGTYVLKTNLLEEDPLGLGKIEDKYRLALELFELRLMIEPEIAAMACRNATEKDLKRLKMLCEETEDLYVKGYSHISKDIEFHTHIAHCGKNHVSEILIPIINTEMLTFANLTHRQLMDETIQTHRAITDAILKRDSVGAKGAMNMHLTYNRQTLLKIMESQGINNREKR